MTDSNSCKVAFIGAGYMSTEHIRAFRDIPGVGLVGVFSRKRIRAEKLALEFGVGLVCNSIAELYEKSKAQLVVISVPELSVREVCLEAFKYPWMCLIEKPAGYDIADAERILEAATNQKRRAFVALNRRHYSSTRTVLEDIANQEGHRLIHVYDQEDQISARKAGQPEMVVQNWMYANSIHVIDYLRMLGRGNIVSVHPIIRWTPENPKFVMAKITYDSGDVGIYEAVWNGPSPWAVTVTTQEKRWELRPLEHALFQAYGSRNLDTIPAHAWDTAFKPGLRLQAQEAVKAIRGEEHNLPSLEEALRTMHLVEKIYSAA